MIPIHDLFPRNDSIVSFKAGQTIFKEGENGDVMHVLCEGMVEVFVGEKLIGTFEPVEIFGEMAVIDPGPRSATVVAKTNCKLGSINQRRFMMLAQHKPEFAIQIMRMLVERIRWMDQTARSHAAEHAEAVAKLETQIKELSATVQAQEERIRELEEQLENARHGEPAMAVA